MTEAEWLASDDAHKMFWGVQPPVIKAVRISRRVTSLFGVACVRVTPGAADQPFLWPAAEVVERAADNGTWDEVNRLVAEAQQHLNKAHSKYGSYSAAFWWAVAGQRLVADNIAYAADVPLALGKVLVADNQPYTEKIYADLLRDTVGNPFCGGRGCMMKARNRKLKPGPLIRAEWRTSTTVALAAQMYESRDFNAMPILADALQDAGCDNTDILAHCCDAKQIHVRGCWAVDLVLGKA